MEFLNSIVAYLGPVGTGVAAVVLPLVVYLILWTRLPKPFEFSLPRDVDEQTAKISFPNYNIQGPVMVTGGAGFLGSHIVTALREQSVPIIVFDIQPAANYNAAPGVTYFCGDLTKKESIVEALRQHNVRAVIHTASPDPNSPNVALLEAVNVGGARNVVAACKEAGVRTLIYTSSASVIWQGLGQSGVDESIAYPTSFRDPYARTKAEAERIIMDGGANSSGQLVTVSLRPHAIFGERDPHMVPTVVQMAKTGKTKFIVGDGGNIVDWTYVGNVVHSHLLATSVAQREGAACKANGKTYFITNDSPMPFWDFMAWMLIGLGYRPFQRRLPYGLVLTIAKVATFVVRTIDTVFRSGQKPTQLTLSVPRLQISGTSHWYCIDAAKRDLGYKPLWNMQQAVFRTLRFFAASKRENFPSRDVVAMARRGNLVALKLVVDHEALEMQRAENRAKIEKASVGANFTMPDESTVPFMTAADVAKHNTLEDLWVIIDGKVYDLTVYAPDHPGSEAIATNAGGDATVGFHGPQHPASVKETVKKFLIGKIKPAGAAATDNAAAAQPAVSGGSSSDSSEQYMPAPTGFKPMMRQGTVN